MVPFLKTTILILCSAFLNFQLSYSQQYDFSESKQFPYTLSAYQEAGLMVLGTGLLYSSAFTHRNLIPLSENQILSLNSQNIPIFERWVSKEWNPRLNTIREILEPVGILAAMGTVGALGLQEKTRNFSWYPLMTLTMMYFEGIYVAEGGVLLMKSIAKRPRPYTYNPELPIEDKLTSSNNESFFSGNGTVMFFNATFISQVLTDVFPDKKWIPYVWAGTHGIALISGIWSVQSGMHFPSDVLVGALWGSAIAYLATHIHKVKSSTVSISPYITQFGNGLTLNLSLK